MLYYLPRIIDAILHDKLELFVMRLIFFYLCLKYISNVDMQKKMSHQQYLSESSNYAFTGKPKITIFVQINIFLMFPFARNEIS